MSDAAFESRSKSIGMMLGEDDTQKKKLCMTYVRKELEAICPSADESKESSKNLRLSTLHSKYLMNRIANYMQSSTNEVAIAESNVEHIFPANPEENEWGGAVGQDLLEPYLWHIGNLTIFGKRMNRKAANREFSIKRQQYKDKTEVEMTKQVAENFQTWGVADIERRGRDLSHFIPHIWNFDNPSRV